eukprot:TRINITY_DN14564_c0_g1_i2.p1 TRINITY_DN14564_c0_g1~~TRINITY_DN14564_c0_g1_i2.p1  ORF type:complete len:638 (+),score=104.68 TRINITY_DN14564_c0_g1_i2:116-2029(+)
MDHAVFEEVRREFDEANVGNAVEVKGDSQVIEYVTVLGLPGLTAGGAHASIGGGHVHVAGLIGARLTHPRTASPNGSTSKKAVRKHVVRGGAGPESYRCCQLIERILQCCRCGWTDLARLTVHLLDGSKNAKAVELALDSFAKDQGCPSAPRSFVGCAGLSFGATVLVEATAIAPRVLGICNLENSLASTCLTPEEHLHEGDSRNSHASASFSPLSPPMLDAGAKEGPPPEPPPSAPTSLAIERAEEGPPPEPPPPAPTSLAIEKAEEHQISTEGDDGKSSAAPSKLIVELGRPATATTAAAREPAVGDGAMEHPCQPTLRPTPVSEMGKAVLKTPLTTKTPEFVPIAPSPRGDLPLVGVHEFFCVEQLSGTTPGFRHGWKVRMLDDGKSRTLRLCPEDLLCTPTQANLGIQLAAPGSSWPIVTWKYTFDVTIVRTLTSFLNVGLVEWVTDRSHREPADLLGGNVETTLTNVLCASPSRKDLAWQHCSETPRQLMLGCRKGIKWYGKDHEPLFKDDICDGSNLSFSCEFAVNVIGETMHLRLWLLPSMIVFRRRGLERVCLGKPLFDVPSQWINALRQNATRKSVWLPAVTAFSKDDVVHFAWSDRFRGSEQAPATTIATIGPPRLLNRPPPGLMLS